FDRPSHRREWHSGQCPFEDRKSQEAILCCGVPLPTRYAPGVLERLGEEPSISGDLVLVWPIGSRDARVPGQVSESPVDELPLRTQSPCKPYAPWDNPRKP